MHETSIALSILSLVEEKFNDTPGAVRVTKIRVLVGSLSLVDPVALKFALEVASKGTPMEGSEIEIEFVEPVFKCRKCGHTWRLTRDELGRIAEDKALAQVLHYYPDLITEHLKCPKCGSRDIDIVEGGGVILESVEIETR